MRKKKTFAIVITRARVFEGMILNSGLCVYALLTKLVRSRWLEFGQVPFCRD